MGYLLIFWKTIITQQKDTKNILLKYFKEIFTHKKSQKILSFQVKPILPSKPFSILIIFKYLKLRDISL